MLYVRDILNYVWYNQEIVITGEKNQELLAVDPVKTALSYGPAFSLLDCYNHYPVKSFGVIGNKLIIKIR